MDIFSKNAWVVPLKTKQGQELVKAFQIILTSGRKPNKLQTDQGTEFLNRGKITFTVFYSQLWAQSVSRGAFQPYL